MQPQYTKVKVYNEIQICELPNLNCKSIVEQELLKNRISYFYSFPTGLRFGKKKNICTLCVNEADSARTKEIVENICQEQSLKLKFLMKKVEKDFL